MKILKISLFMSYLTLILVGSVSAEKICMTDQSIIQQKKRYVSQGLLVSFMKDKLLFSWPVKVCECWISSLFGWRQSGFHYGVDFAATKGTHVLAAADGYVESAQKSHLQYGYGNMILVRHDQLGCKTRYAHLHSLHVEVGQQVKRGQKIGTVGATGHVIGKKKGGDPSHLHFEIYKGDSRVDPLKYLFASDIMLLKNKKL